MAGKAVKNQNDYVNGLFRIKIKKVVDDDDDNNDNSAFSRIDVGNVKEKATVVAGSSNV